MALVWELYARCYDSIATLPPYGELVETVIDAAGSETPGRVLDAGCGTGNVAAPGGRLVVTTPRAGAATRPIVRASGLGAVLRRLGPMLLVGVINARLLRDRAHHFLTRAEFAELTGGDRPREAYAGQNWLATVGPGDCARRR